MTLKHVIIIGGGATGCAVAHDLALRGLEVTVIERGSIACGTSGRNGGVLHSGARYCVADPESAIECVRENKIFKRIAPSGTMETNGGLFVLLEGDDQSYADKWLNGCFECSIDTQETTLEKVVSIEPKATRNIKLAVITPDAVIEPLRFTLTFAATAKANGVRFLLYSEVQELMILSGKVEGVRVYDRMNNHVFDLKGDMVVNAGGPWSGKIAEMAGIQLPLILRAGMHVVIEKRLTNRIIFRMCQPTDGDVVIPHRNTSTIGSSSWPVDDCDFLYPPSDQIPGMVKAGITLVPEIEKCSIKAIFCSTRALIDNGLLADRDISRTFKCFDHAELDKLEGFVTITGGKLITSRLMAEKISDLICLRLGIIETCKTHLQQLLSYRCFYF
jgi:glycerol-3-phosphate dehydrogenase